MYYVYVLADTNKRFYSGKTKDIKRRVKEHRQGQCHTTARMDKPELIFYEGFKAEDDAARREKYFKTTKGKKVLRLMLRESLNI